ncbi:MAG TPA: elongation factor P [candidate division Zixibacteria bacterium]|nr:elongation factor P [candidate division Zixibacteria bacterium]
MIVASDVRSGLVIQLDRDLYKVEAARLHKGGGQAGATVHLTLRNLRTGNVTERRLRPTEKLEDVVLERLTAEYLYEDTERCYFMDVESYEQLEVPKRMLGDRLAFLQPNMRIDMELLEGRPVDVLFPATVDLKVASTGPGVHESEATYKPAVLENGIEILVPQFIKTGDTVRVDVQTRKYVERVKA